MPKLARELTAIAVSKFKRRGRYAVGGVRGLYLQVTKTGARSWVYRQLIGESRKELGLGPYPAVSLCVAREKARELHRSIAQGLQPVEQQNGKQQQKRSEQPQRAEAQPTITFAKAAAAYIESKKHEWSNDKSQVSWEGTLQKYAYPTIGKLEVNQIEIAHMHKLLTRIWHNKTETAMRLRGRIEAVLDWATVQKYRAGPNPAAWKGNLDKLLAKPGKVRAVEHHPALPADQVPAFLERLRRMSGAAARALEFVILTACRTGEVIGACWDELDLEKAEWRIPAARMKSRRPHVIPLSKGALELIAQVPRLDSSPYVFRNAAAGPLGSMALLAVLKRMDIKGITVHGFRSTFRDWAAESTNHPREVVEHALAHKVGDRTEQAYHRSTLLVKRSQLMADWSDYCRGTPPLDRREAD